MNKRKISVRLGVVFLAAMSLLSAFSGTVNAAGESGAATASDTAGPVDPGAADTSGPADPGASGTTSVITPTGITIDTLEQEIDAVVAPFIGETCPGAAIVVVKDGEVVFSKGYGYANTSDMTPVDPDTTVFEWGSVSKTFLWTAIMQLKERGLIDLEAPISSYIPADFYAKLGIRYDITMLDLMNHRAGFEEVYHDLISEKKRDAVALSDALLNYIPRQVFKPGTVTAYSNYSAALAGYVVECISGQSFVDYVHENILAPLDMSSTALEQDLSDAPQLLPAKATGYQMAESGEIKEGSNSYVNLYAAGSMNGTATDIAQYVLSLCSGESVLFDTDDTRKEMFTETYRSSAEFPGCAHGFWTYEGATTGYGHGGNTNYFSSQVMVAPDEHFGFAILTNMQYETDVINSVGRFLLGDPLIIDLPESADAMPDPAEFAGGTYVCARNNFSAPIFSLMGTLSMITVEKTGGNTIALTSVLIPSESYGYIQTSPGIFTAEEPGGMMNKFCFIRENGKVAAISDGSGADFIPLDSVAGMSRDKALVSIGVLGVIAAFCLISLPVYICIAVVNLLRKPEAVKMLSKASRRVRFAGRLIVSAALLTYANLFIFAVRVLEWSDFSKITTNLHTGIGILTWILFIVAFSRVVVLLIRERREIKKTVAIKAVLTSICIGSMYVVLALWNFFAII